MKQNSSTFVSIWISLIHPVPRMYALLHGAGASAREGLSLLQGLAGLNFVAVDVNTVSPPHDVGGMTAFLAGTVMLECMALVCQNSQTISDRKTKTITT